MRRHKDMNLEKRIFDFCIWFMAVICLLALLTSSCSATVPLPTTPTIAVTATATDQKRTTPSPTPQVCTVQTGVPSGYLNLRTGAGTEYALIRVLREGEILTILERGVWLSVMDSQGHQGYVNARFCR